MVFASLDRKKCGKMKRYIVQKRFNIIPLLSRSPVPWVALACGLALAVTFKSHLIVMQYRQYGQGRKSYRLLELAGGAPELQGSSPIFSNPTYVFPNDVLFGAVYWATGECVHESVAVWGDICRQLRQRRVAWRLQKRCYSHIIMCVTQVTTQQSAIGLCLESVQTSS
jgi:hypothetical protein